jgi:hypothetical protein
MRAWPQRRRAALASLLALLAPLILGSLCEGDGATSPGRVTQGPVDPRCAPVGGPYPSGFDLLPGDGARGVVMQFSPAGVLAFDLDSAPPRLLSHHTIPSLPGDGDSDGDGTDDADRYQALGLCPSFNPGCRTYPRVGALDAPFADLIFVTASGYEEVLFYEPASGDLTGLLVENPIDSPEHRAADHLFLPPGGESALRTALSTKVCIYPPSMIDSLGDDISADPLCDPDRGGFFTKFTAASTLVGGRLFVATSNLKSPSIARYFPGSVLVYEFDTAHDPPRLRPAIGSSVIYTSAFNPAGLTPHRTRSGRDLVLVTQTGALDQSGRLLTEAAVDVIDANAGRVVATIPLGLAGASFGPMALDPSGRIALLGAESARRIFAIDLAPLENPELYDGSGPPIVLDGATAGFPDARIFSADAPFDLPSRLGGPPLRVCPPRTNVAINYAGDRAYVTDWCDATLIVIELDLDGADEQPFRRDRIRVHGSIDLLTPKTPEAFGSLTAPSMVRVRPGRPGRDFDGPDVFFIANEPEGQLCALRVDY